MAQYYVGASHLHGCTAARMPRQNLCCLQLNIHTSGASDLTGGFDSIGVGICTALAPRAFMFNIARSHRSNVKRLLRQGIKELRNHLCRRSLFYGRHRGCRSALERHLLQPIQGEIAAATSHIAGDGLQHVRQQRRRQDGLIRLKRILHFYGAAASIILVEAPHIKRIISHERCRQYLGIAGIGKTMSDSPTTLLRRG